MKITKYVKGGYDYVHHGPSSYDSMKENGWNEAEEGFWNQPPTSNTEEEQQPVEGNEDFVIDYKIPDDPEYIAREERRRKAMELADEEDYYDRLHGEGLYEGNPHDVYGAEDDIPFGDDEPYDQYDEEFEKDQQRNQELLDQYGGAIRIWYYDNTVGGKEGSYISPGTDVAKAVTDAINQTSSKDPNAFIITQVDVLEGYYDPESGMTPYDGEPVWRVGDSPSSRDIWNDAEYVLKNLRLDTKEGWIREQASQYGTDLQGKETIKDLGLSEGKFKNEHEFDVLWDFAIDYDDDDIDATTEGGNDMKIAITSATCDVKGGSYKDLKQRIAEMKAIGDKKTPIDEAIKQMTDSQLMKYIKENGLYDDYKDAYNMRQDLSVKRIKQLLVQNHMKGSVTASSYPAHLKDHFADRATARQFLSGFDSSFLSDLEESWKDYLHEMSEYYFARDKGREISRPNQGEWLAGLAEDYPDISDEDLEKAWECMEAVDDSSLPYI